MAKLEWDSIGEHFYETGIDRGVLYPLIKGSCETGMAWNGIANVSQNISGGEATSIYADNIKYLNIMSAEELGLTIEAYDQPDAFDECDGMVEITDGVNICQQKRKHFGFSFRNKVGNDMEDDEYGYKVHIVFDCVASPADKSYQTINDTPEAIIKSWDVSTTPVSVGSGYKPVAEIILDARLLRNAGLWNVLEALEDILYGTAATDPVMPSASEILTVYEQSMYLRDSSGSYILDSSGDKIQSSVFE